MQSRPYFQAIFAVLLFSSALLGQSATAPAKSTGTAQAIDPEHSKLTVRVYKTGLFSSLGHDHEIVAPITEGSVTEGDKPAVHIKVMVADMRVMDTDLEAKKRSDVQDTMLSSKVLDANSFPEITFASTRVVQTAPGNWIITGTLTLHGETHGINFRVAKANGHYTGSTTFKQRDFGITPVSVAGGSIKVKDEVTIEFDIVTKK
jgi:polyisoprenoid-binding protein YceI